MNSLEEIWSQLGLNESNGLFLTDNETWKNETAFPNRVKRLLEREIKPKAFFCFDNKPIVLFFENPIDKFKLHKAIWNFNECPIVIIVEGNSVEVFNGFHFDGDVKLLQKLGALEKLSDFSYFELVTGRTWELYKNELDYKNRVDYHLLQNIKTARKLLVEQHKLSSKITNAIIGKSIFVRYLIDRKVKMKFDGKLRIWTNDEFCMLFVDPEKIKYFFNYLDDNEKGFNGDLFPLTDEEYNKISIKDYDVLKRLLQGENIESGQSSLFQFYDFSIIPIEFISNVYELFIGDDNQKKAGAYYTPLFLVDYILRETVEKKLETESSLPNCKVLDPACGSGIFLVETLRKIIERFIQNTNIEVKSEKFKTAIKNLAKENIFGIDKDLSAVQVAIFSIYLTLLDYLEPPGIETFKFPLLFNTNFFEADFFDEESPFNNQLKEIEFSFILGNPPWMRGKGEKEKPLYVEYIEKRKKREESKDSPKIDIGNKEIAQAFLLRSSDFSKVKTKSALIVTSKVLYNLQSASFRKYLLHHFFIERVFELAPVRREVFDKSNDKAIAPACVLFFSYSNGFNTDLNIIEHIALKPNRFFTLFKIFTINRTDFKTVQQNKLKEYDWLWKVLVYGSYLDFNFLKRLKDDYSSVRSILNTKGALIKQGIKRKDGTKKIDVSELIGWDFIDLNKKNIQQLHIKTKLEKWSIGTVGYIYRENDRICIDVFSPPMLLIKETVNTELESIAAVSFREVLFTDKITSIKFRGSQDVNDYYLLAGLMSSTLFAYYILNISSTAGVMIEQQINDFEKFEFPYNYSDEIVELAQSIEILKKGVTEELVDYQLRIQTIESKAKEINQSIYKLYSLNENEQALVDYAKEVTIPISMKHKGYDGLFRSLPFRDPFLQEYAKLFFKRFKSKLDTKHEKFVVEIWHTNQIIGMFFKVVSVSDYSESIIWVNKQNNDTEIISFLLKLSSERITDRLFVQKDVRGFEKKYFYIFKPNEKRLWHKAIGYIDVDEFADAMLTVEES